jgi:hypothetical protein
MSNSIHFDHLRSRFIVKMLLMCSKFKSSSDERERGRERLVVIIRSRWSTHALRFSIEHIDNATHYF